MLTESNLDRIAVINSKANELDAFTRAMFGVNLQFALSTHAKEGHTLQPEQMIDLMEAALCETKKNKWEPEVVPCFRR